MFKKYDAASENFHNISKSAALKTHMYMPGSKYKHKFEQSQQLEEAQM